MTFPDVGDLIVFQNDATLETYEGIVTQLVIGQGPPVVIVCTEDHGDRWCGMPEITSINGVPT